MGLQFWREAALTYTDFSSCLNEVLSTKRWTKQAGGHYLKTVNEATAACVRQKIDAFSETISGFPKS